MNSMDQQITTVLSTTAETTAVKTKQGMKTKLVRAGIAIDLHHGAVVPPLHLSTNYSFIDQQTPRQFDYARSGNPSRQTLTQALAALEGGIDACVTASGLAAITLVLQLLSADDLLVVPHDCYGGSLRLFTHLAAKGHFRLQVLDQTAANSLQQIQALKPQMIWLETPSNPLLRVVDIQAYHQLAKQLENCLLVVDNTFLSPILQQPFALGADIIVHSTTKYLNGHSDVIGGVAIAKDAAIAEKLAWWGNTLGLTGGAFDSYLTLRGLRTLALRMQAHEQNTQQLVRALTSHQAVCHVYYPGLSHHPQHELACRQQQGFGGMVSFELCGDQAQVEVLLHELKLFTLAESLGGVESLIAVPATMTHRAMTDAQQQQAGLDKTLIRLSVGIEDGEDLVADLTYALDCVSHSLLKSPSE